MKNGKPCSNWFDHLWMWDHLFTEREGIRERMVEPKKFQCPEKGEKLWLIHHRHRHYKLNLVLHMSPTTFFGWGLSGPLSRCPDVKYSHPSQNPAIVVLIRYGSLPITDHFCNTGRSSWMSKEEQLHKQLHVLEKRKTRKTSSRSLELIVFALCCKHFFQMERVMKAWRHKAIQP